MIQHLELVRVMKCNSNFCTEFVERATKVNGMEIYLPCKDCCFSFKIKEEQAITMCRRVNLDRVRTS